jgi:hypothetical protein
MRREDNVCLVCNIYTFLRPLPCLHQHNTVFYRHAKPSTRISEVKLDVKEIYKTSRRASYLNDALLSEEYTNDRKTKCERTSVTRLKSNVTQCYKYF